MSEAVIFFIAAVLVFALVPFVPKLMRFRITVLNWLHWRWLANLHERHFIGFVLAARVIIMAVGVLLVILGIARL